MNNIKVGVFPVNFACPCYCSVLFVCVFVGWLLKAATPSPVNRCLKKKKLPGDNLVSEGTFVLRSKF